MKLLQFSVTLVITIVACIAAKKSDLIQKRVSHATRIYNGHELGYGWANPRCWSYCGLNWVGSEN